MKDGAEIVDPLNFPRAPDKSPYAYSDPTGEHTYERVADDKALGKLCKIFNCHWQGFSQCAWTCSEGTGYSSPLLVDVFGLGYPDLLAGKLWRKDRPNKVSESAFRSFDLDLTGSKLWEWVGAKSGILVYQKVVDAKDIPSVIDGSALFGNRTFGNTWANGYEALESLDKDKDGQLVGAELTNLWVWVDANSNARVDQGEAKAAASYVKALNVRPVVYPSGDAEAPKGAVLQSGAMVPTWDWWSAAAPADAIVIQRETPSVYFAPKVQGTPPAAAKVYIWGMGGKMLGLLRFVKVGTDQYVVSLPFGTKPVVGYYSALFSKIHRTPGKLDWRFTGDFGGLSELAFVTGTPSQLIGENGRNAPGMDREAYTWKAVVLSGKVDEWVGAHVRAVAGFTDAEFTAAIASVAGDAGTVRLLGGGDTSKTTFVPLAAF